MQQAAGRGARGAGYADMTIDHRLQNMEVAIQDIRDSYVRIADAIERLVVLETQHVETREALARAFKECEKLDERLKAIERHMPIVHLIVYGAGAAVIGALGAIGMALLKLVNLGENT